MHRFTRLVALGGTLAALLIGSTTGVYAAAPAPDVVGHVYVNNNSAGENTVAGFDRHADGTLTADRRLAILRRRRRDGQRRSVRPGPSSSRRTVVTSWPWTPPATRSRCSASGTTARSTSSRPTARTAPRRSASRSAATWSMSPISAPAAATTRASRSTAAATSGRSPTPRTPCPTTPCPATCCSAATVAISSAPASVRTPARRSSTASAWAADGRLTPAPGSPFAAQRIGPFGSAFRPTNPDQLFVSNAHDGALAGQRLGLRRRRRRHADRDRRARRSPTTRPPRAGSRSAMTATSCSRSTPAAARSRATASPPTAA